MQQLSLHGAVLLFPGLLHRPLFTLDRLLCEGDVKVFIKKDVGDFWLPIIYRTFQVTGQMFKA